MADKPTSIFDEFTGKYSLSKTLRFELKPVGKTADLLTQNKVFEKDKAINDHYHEIKYYFDALHREFIYDALSGVSFPATSYEEYKKAIERLKATKNENKKAERKHAEDIEVKLRAELVQKFEETGNIWKEDYAKRGITFKKEGTEILFEEAVLEALQKRSEDTPDDADAPPIEFIDQSTGEKKNLFDSFKGFFTYFSNFHNTKRNLYSAEDKDTAVANRAINENLRKFIDNIIQFKERENEYAKTGLTSDEEMVFDPMFYDKCFTQDGIDAYNRVMGGYTKESGEKIRGINEKINLYNQQYGDKKLRQFGQLFKQIMSKKDKKARIAEIKDDQDVFKTLRAFMALNDEKLNGAKDMMGAKALMDSFFRKDNEYDISRIYVKGIALNTISSKWFSNWSVIGNMLSANSGSKKKSKKSPAGDEDKKLPDLVSFGELKNTLESRSAEGENYIAAKDLFREDYRMTYSGAKDHYKAFLKIWEKEWRDCLDEYSATMGIVEKMTDKESYRRDSEEQIAKIKAYCDAVLAVFQMMKYFALEKGRKAVVPENGSEDAFYNPFNAYYQDYPAPAYYNEFRNYLTRKAHLGRLLFPSFGGNPTQRHPLSKRVLDGAEKIKLNFEKGSFLSGWAQTYDQYGGIIFRKKRSRNDDEYLYYLGILLERFTDEYRDLLVQSINEKNVAERVIYKLQKMDFKNFPRMFINSKYDQEAPAIKKYNLPIHTIWNDYQTYKKLDENGKNKFLEEKTDFRHRMIDYYKKCVPLHESLQSFKDKLPSFWKDTEEYKNLPEFYNDTLRACYELSFEMINFDALDDLVRRGKLYLFQIYNKDFSLDEAIGISKYGDNFVREEEWRKLQKKEENKKRGKNNMHTLYFKALFDSNNLLGPLIKLSGGAEVFFRPQNNQLKKKMLREKGVIEHKRYGENKVFLHMSIELNMGVGGESRFNGKINSLIAEKENTKKVKIIGVDRGEKHLAYYTVIDQEGNLIDGPNAAGHLDGELPNGSSYLKKLEEKAGKRDEARKEWKTIENIKELKSGYISWVVRKLADMMLNENAILVFEDLTIGFKRGRQKIEQQVYQKLELALVQKLNYLVQKDASPGAAGHYLKAHQLTPKVQTPQDIGKQCGAVFYVSPGYTSLTCPKCGYRKNISFPFENIDKAKALIKKINLTITSQKDDFVVAYTLSDKENGATGDFKVSSGVERIRWHRNGTDYMKNHRRGESLIEESKSKAGIAKRYNITECLKGLFENNGVDIRQAYTADILANFDSAEFYRNLFRYLDLLLRSRNAISGTDTDYIQCPRCLFHSDNGFQGQKWNGDANGAYNIARKGLLILKKIQNAKEPEKISWKDLKISVGEWDEAMAK